MTKSIAPLICPECDSGKLEKKKAELTGEVRGESYTVISEALVCPQCGFKTVPKEKAGKFGLAIADAYRESHGLLTSEDLIRLRRQFRMTQDEFAAFTGVSLASLKRWELGQIQDRAMDTLMRVKTDLGAALANVQNLEREISEQHISSGVIGDFEFDLSVFTQPRFVTTNPHQWSVDLSAMRYGDFKLEAA